MREAALVFDSRGHTIAWHQPPESTSTLIPDSRELWDVLWKHRASLGGVAHLHPWDGPPEPSSTDVSTFRAIESALGRLLLWPIATLNEVSFLGWNPITQQYVPCPSPSFAPQLDLGALRLLGQGAWGVGK
jgi:hypothetical protein